MRSTILYLILFFSLQATISGQMALADRKKEIKIAFSSWPPYEYQDEGKSSKGINLELVKLTLEKLGYIVKFDIFPWKRAYESAKDGKYDAVFSMGKRPEREIHFHFPSEPLLVTKWLLFFKKGKIVPFKNDLKALKGLTIGIANGYNYGETFNNADFFKKESVTNDLQNLKKLAAGHIHAAVCDNINCPILIKENGLNDQIEPYKKTAIDIIPMFIGFSKKSLLIKSHSAFLDQFSLALRDIKASGVAGKILEKYGISLPDL